MGEYPEPSRDAPLSPHERSALARIEAELRHDRRFARRMSGGPSAIWLRLAVALMTLASVFLAVIGARTSDRAVLWCFAVVWPLTLVQAFRLLCRATRDGVPARRGGGWPD
ncbi:DUF3040 domain-containing protein [Streptomyces sp. NPDC102462]|uniref:DUF3040 domain-containing protein n=1 Tax=Streptomyces sp. NPDC102462 TaxID=3366178 RepID=UPI00381B0DCF